MARKKGFSQQQRRTILDSARAIIREGVSRRSMDFILRQRFGVSISRESFTALFRKHQADVERTRARQHLPVRRHPIRSEDDRYQELRRRGFLHEEAMEFKKAKSLKYHEFQRMSLSRQNMLKTFSHRTGLNPGDPNFSKEWRVYIYAWYKKSNLTTFNARLKRVISPWDWFDQVSYRLPPELRYSKKGRRKNEKGRSGQETASMRAFRLRSINQLKETLRRNPARAGELIPQITKLGGKVPKE